jgi:repressor LexA
VKELTEKQEEILDIVKWFIKDFGYSPSIREICELSGRKSTATVKTHLDTLLNKGYILYNPKKSRTIRVVEVK